MTDLSRLPKLIGLAGLKGSGKDTLALELCQIGYRRTAFADPLYKEVAANFNCTVEQLSNRSTKELPVPWLTARKCWHPEFKRLLLGQLGCQLDERLSPRQVLQWWGTEFRRIHCKMPMYWIDKLLQVIAQPGPWVITDVRFETELALVLDQGGQMYRVTRPGLFLAETAHVSEKEMAAIPLPEVANDKTPADLFAAFMARVLAQPKELAHA